MLLSVFTGAAMLFCCILVKAHVLPRTVLVSLLLIFCTVSCRGPGSAQVRYAEASMRNGFGLKYIYKFFNLPFLYLQVSRTSVQLQSSLGSFRS